MNKVDLIGRLTRNPEVRYSNGQDGTQLAIARFTLAINRGTKGQDGQPQADFISCVAFGRPAENAEKYLTQGLRIGVSGRLQTGSYTNKDGVKVYTTDVIVTEWEFADGKAQGGQQAAPQGQQQPQQGQRQQGQRQQPQQAPADYGFMDIPPGIEADLPFK